MPVENSYLDEFKVKNRTDRPITLGDLVNVTVPPRKTIDLLKQPRVTKEKINQSKHLQAAVKAGLLEIIKPSPCPKPKSEKQAILADAETACQGAGTIVEGSGMQGFQGWQGQTGPGAGDTGPQGFQGWQATQGLQGFQGVQGFQGWQGLSGIQGHQGLQGWQGSIGLQGIQGWQGLSGIQGHQGTQGWQGLIGLQGAQGYQGRQGWQGLIGLQGAQGTQGWQGFQGWQGPGNDEAGMQGFQGFQGPGNNEAGTQGFQGVQGFQGWQGWQGLSGTQGYQGPQGFQGFQGIQGRQGAQGWQGSIGLQGGQGVQGWQGLSGVQGHQGIQGWQGLIGLQGLQGWQGSIGLQGSQGWQGLSGIQGYQGTQGWQGPIGLQGVQGWQGLSGVQGFQGFQGLQGFQGWQGPGNDEAGMQGSQGFQGSQGLQGLQGRQGWQGLIGLQGNQGFQGWQGFSGVQGFQGWQGLQGVQGFQGWQGLSGIQGHQGTQGWQGLIGLQGIQGFQGFQGWQGLTGVQGFQGLQGWQGPIGLQGAQGRQGFQGFQGWQGFSGVQGFQGFQGWQGFSGIQGYQGLQGWQGWQGFQGSFTGTACDIDLGGTDEMWEDGLFTWTPTGTQVCEALDSINELLLSLVPPPAPDLDYMSASTTGASVNLSFGASASANPAGYSNHSTLDVDDLFVSTGVAPTWRKGVINATTSLSGTLNDDVTAGPGSPTAAYPADSFGGGNLGTLYLYVNGSSVHSVDLSVFSSGSTVNGNGSGFNLSAATYIKFPNGDDFTFFTYRTGTWTVNYADLRTGYNYIKVDHDIAGDITSTQTWEYIVDDNTTDTSYTGGAFSSLATGSTKHLSGIEYHTGSGSITATYTITANNAYANTYSDEANAVNHPTDDNCSITDTAIPALLPTGTYSSAIEVSKTCTIDQTRVIKGETGQNGQYGFRVSTKIERTFSADETTSSSASDYEFCYDNASATSTDISHDFDDENYRLQGSGNDFNTNLSADWDETVELNGADAGHNEGLQTINGKIVYPTYDFSGITDGPAGNPDYSTCTGTRYYFGYFTNSTAAANFTLSINGSGTLVEDGDLNTTSEVSVCMRWPGVSGWLDVAKAFEANQWGSTADAYNASPTRGCYASTYGNVLNIGASSNIGITIGTKDTSQSYDKIYYRIKVIEGFTGNISSISIEWPYVA